jgi:hypothetical protein
MYALGNEVTSLPRLVVGKIRYPYSQDIDIILGDFKCHALKELVLKPVNDE